MKFIESNRCSSFVFLCRTQDSNVTTVLDDYTAQSSQELSVSKGQRVQIIQRSLPDATNWCLIRVLNGQHPSLSPRSSQKTSNPPSLATSSTSIAVGLGDSSTTKYSQGLVPASILKATKSSSSNVHLSPTTVLPQTPTISNHTEAGCHLFSIDVRRKNNRFSFAE